MNYLLCHPEIERFLIPDSKSKNAITQDSHNLELSMLLGSMQNESSNIQQINTGNEALAKGEGMDTKIMSDNRPEIKEMPKIMPELIMKGFIKSPVPDTVTGEDLKIIASNISGAKEAVNESAALRKGYEKYPSPLPSPTRGEGTTISPVPDTVTGEDLKIIASNISGTKEAVNESAALRKGYEKYPSPLPSPTRGEGTTISPVPDTVTGEDLKIIASNISGAKEAVNESAALRKGYEKYPSPLPSPTRGEGTTIIHPPLTGGGEGEGVRLFSEQNNKAGDFINHGKDEDGFNYVSNKTDANAFSHMFGEHSQNKNNSGTSEVVTDARRIIDIPENRFQIISKDATSVEISVEPEEIGRLDIKLSLDKDAVKAKITAFEYVGKEVMDRNIYNIVDSLIKEGINISGFSVFLKDRRDNQNNSFNENKPEIEKQAAERESGDDLTGNSTISIFI